MPDTRDHTDYLAFLRKKIKLANFDGFDVADAEINPLLKPHERDIVKWAVKGGNRAIFAAFGLGKSVMQIEILRLVQKHEGGDVIDCLPLGVRQEFRRDGMFIGAHWEARAI